MKYDNGTIAVKESGVSVAEYLALGLIYHNASERGLVIESFVYDELNEKGFIEIDSITKTWTLSRKGRELFEPSNNNYERFITTFPTRVKNQLGETRILSPASIEAQAAKKIYKKWKTVTKGKDSYQKHIIRCLEAEIKFRENTGNLYWMRNIETWLENFTWEDYEYLLDEEEQVNLSRKGEIKL